MKISKILIVAVATTGILAACTEESPITNPPVIKEENVIDRSAFAKGADVSWLTQLEKEGEVFYTPEDRVETECMQLLRDECGMNSIRLRVWVNPINGWCNVEDVVVKARRANELGMRVMIDFHFSDTWADPANQVTPEEWVNYDIAQMQVAVAEHVTEMLTKLQELGIEPEWVQIGNETRNGMLHPLGHYENGENYSLLVNAGYDAVKAIFPDAQVIIHLDSGDNLSLYTRIFGYLSQNSGKYDMIGMSLYPDVNTWQDQVDACISNINAVAATYSKPVMICEVGMRYDEVEVSKEMLTYLRNQCENATNGQCKGIFYWEPEAPAGYNNGYYLGAFADGAPTEALNAFKD